MPFSGTGRITMRRSSWRDFLRRACGGSLCPSRVEGSRLHQTNAALPRNYPDHNPDQFWANLGFSVAPAGSRATDQEFLCRPEIGPLVCGGAHVGNEFAEVH
jgi:hypothetical protein